MKRMVAFAMCWCVFLPAMAVDELVTVTNVTRSLMLNYNLTNYTVTAETVHQTEYPSDIGDPIFWFDCRRTDNWTFAADGSVAKIPSLVGERYLATDTEGGLHQIAWTSKNPLFVAKDDIMGGPALDFGVKGSMRAMSFNKVGPADGVQTNMLEGIGTVIAVWYSSLGNSSYGGLDGRGSGSWGEGGYYGGALLGGGFGTDGNVNDIKNQYVLYRGTPNSRQYETSGDINRPRWYDNPFANNSHTHAAIRFGHIRHNGQHAAPTVTGFYNGWEVVSVVPNANVSLFNATGLGMNDSRISAVSGGFKVAEMLIFGKVLSVEETARVESYLQRRWFNRDVAGYNGNAFVSRIRAYRYVSGNAVGVHVPVAVAQGEKLTIGELRGGRGYDNPSIDKSGEGSIEILDSSRYGGEVRMEGGTLEFTARSMPQALPQGRFLHFDTSSSDSFVTNSLGEFVRFNNLAEKASYKVHEICARPSGTTPPAILLDELGSGKHALDFGNYVKDDFSRALTFATNQTEEVSSVVAYPSGIMTVIAVVGAHRGGSGLLLPNSNVGYFSRGSSLPCRFDVILSTANGYSIENTLTDKKYVTAMIDALPIDVATSGYLHPSYQVVAIRTPGNGSSKGIGAVAWGSGGLRLCEFAAWKHALTDDEMRDASAYLMQKWLGKVAPGYGGENGKLKKVVATGDVRVNVVTGVGKIGKLIAEGGSIEKVGSGVLEYEELDAEELKISGGSVRKKVKSDVSSASEVAAAPALHLDVTDLSSMRIETVEEERRIYEWYSQGDKTIMAGVPFRINNDSNDTTTYKGYQYAPFLSSEVQLNGHDTIDFGPFTAAMGGRAFSLSRSFDCVRSAYIVWTPRDDTRGNYFGCSNANIDKQQNGEFYDFIRTDSATNSAALVLNNGTSNHVRDGLILTNGVLASAGIVPQPGVFTLTEFHPAAGAHISAIGTDRDIARFSGGIRVAEVILFERELSEREKIATRNYLMAKWFNAEPKELPAQEELVEHKKFTLSNNVAFDAVVSSGIDKICGEGVLTKTGIEELSLKELCGFTGTVAIANGTLKLSGRSPRMLGGLAAADDLLFHADATSGITAITNANGKIEVTEWKSTLNNGWTAVPLYDTSRPTLIKADDLNGEYVVDMGTKYNKQAMLFAYNGVTNLLENIGSVFWMIGSHNGGGYLLGGGRHYSNWEGGRFNFMRGSSSGKGDRPESPILNSAWVCPFNIQGALWRKDGVEIEPLEEGLSGGWDLLSMNITNTTWPYTNADGFAFDGRELTGGYGSGEYMGSQRLAEVLIYNRKLTDEETAEVEAYLARKWRFKGTNSDITNSVNFVIAEGATLDLGNERQYVKSLAGLGTVQNGTVAAGELVVDASSDDRMTFAESATLEIYPGMRILLSNLGGAAAGDVIGLAECAISERENLRSCVVEVEGIDSDKIRPRLRYRDGVLSVNLVPAPSFIIVR